MRLEGNYVSDLSDQSTPKNITTIAVVVIAVIVMLFLVIRSRHVESTSSNNINVGHIENSGPPETFRNGHESIVPKEFGPSSVFNLKLDKPVIWKPRPVNRTNFAGRVRGMAVSEPQTVKRLKVCMDVLIGCGSDDLQPVVTLLRLNNKNSVMLNLVPVYINSGQVQVSLHMKYGDNSEAVISSDAPIAVGKPAQIEFEIVQSAFARLTVNNHSSSKELSAGKTIDLGDDETGIVWSSQVGSPSQGFGASVPIEIGRPTRAVEYNKVANVRYNGLSRSEDGEGFHDPARPGPAHLDRASWIQPDRRLIASETTQKLPRRRLMSRQERDAEHRMQRRRASRQTLENTKSNIPRHRQYSGTGDREFEAVNGGRRLGLGMGMGLGNGVGTVDVHASKHKSKSKSSGNQR